MKNTMITMITMTMMTMKAKNKIQKENFIISDGCCVQYGDTLALDNETFKVSEGKMVAVVGPNGGGKSTLVQVLIGLYPVKSGDILYDNVSVKNIGLDVVREHVATVLQNPALFNAVSYTHLTLPTNREV